MNNELLEMLQGFIVIIIIICAAIVMHNIMATFDVLKYWYGIFFGAVIYLAIEEKLNPEK